MHRDSLCSRLLFTACLTYFSLVIQLRFAYKKLSSKSRIVYQGEMAAQYILEHSSHMTPDPDGFRRSMKNIVKSHLQNPLNVSKTRHFSREIPKLRFRNFNLRHRDRGVTQNRYY